MYTRKTVIINKTGLHARPASEFIACSNKYKSRITIKRIDNNEEANAKSIMLLLTLALEKGTEVEISACGEDEKEAVDSLVSLIESGFDED